MGIFAGGVADFATGHFARSLPFLLIPIGWIFFAIMAFPGKRMVRSLLEKISALLQDVTQLLDATSAFPDE